jgi:hypothetical protein
MRYLDIARSVGSETRKTKEVRVDGDARSVGGDGGEPTRHEKNEENEKSPGARLAAAEAERLKARIVTVVTVDPKRFDRAEYESLMARWEAHEAAGGYS